MIAIDTNLIIRYFVDDHPSQTARSREIIDGTSVFVSLTVVLEAAWVLRSIYRFERAEIIDTFRTFAGMPSVTIEDAAMVAEALDLFAKGMDFADALHLLRARHCETLVTFDRKFIKTAHAAGHPIVKEA